MKNVFCIAAVSLEKTGEWFIAKDSNHFVDWVSTQDKDFFRKKVGDAGVAVMGRNTYNTIFTKLGAGLPYVRNVVYSHPKEGELTGAEITQESPADLIARLREDPKIHAIAVIGGADIYTQFTHAGVIDTFYVSVHSNIQFGTGVPLFTDKGITLTQPFSEEKLDDKTKLLTFDMSKD